MHLYNKCVGPATIVLLRSTIYSGTCTMHMIDAVRFGTFINMLFKSMFKNATMRIWMLYMY